jgi:hypothetical protein
MRRKYGFDANSSLALKMRRLLRSRFGISSRPVAVHTPVPWYWRALVVAVLLAIALALAGWVYDAGRRFAGFDRSETEQELHNLRERVATLQTDFDNQRNVADAGESSLQIERTAQQQLTLQVKRLEQENSRLKEDLAVFESLAQSEGNNRPGLSIHRLRVEQDGAGSGQYRYRMLIAVQGNRREREFNGSLQLVVSMQLDAKLAMITLPRPDEADASSYNISFKHFRRIEGVFRVPTGAVVKNVEARMMQGGSLVATQSVAL